jgi:hypothetical protein
LPPIDDQRRELSALLRGALPPERAERIESLMRDTISITLRNARKADNAVGASRLSGCPDLPAGMAWPTKADGAVRFVGQLRLEDLAPFDVHHKLPPRGLLSFFHGFLTNGEYGIEGRVFYFPELDGFAPVVPPESRGRPRATGITFGALAMLPPHNSPLVPYQGPDDPYVDLFDAHYRMYDGEFEFHGLFGFDRPREGEQRADEEILLRLDPPAPYDFVEAACAYYFIPRDALAGADFSTTRLYEGASI